jgi:protoporphyrinogen oxidase
MELPLALARRIKHLHPACGVKRINTDKKYIVTSSGEKEPFDRLISTIPLPDLPHLISDIPADTGALFKKLKWNSILNLNFGVNREFLGRHHWVYFPQKDISFFRVGFPANFSSSVTPKEKSSIYVEVSYSTHRPLDKKTIVADVIDDLHRTGVLLKGDHPRLLDTNDIEYGYPLYDRNYFAAREGIVGFLQERGIVSCGRYGSWKYMSMEGAILDGKRAAQVCV